MFSALSTCYVPLVHFAGPNARLPQALATSMLAQEGSLLREVFLVCGEEVLPGGSNDKTNEYTNK